MFSAMMFITSCSDSRMAAESQIDVGSGHLVQLLKMSTQTEGSGFEVAPRRSKRSVFLHSGIRICPKETISEVLANHQTYYQLRGTSSNTYRHIYESTAPNSDLRQFSYSTKYKCSFMDWKLWTAFQDLSSTHPQTSIYCYHILKQTFEEKKSLTP